MYQENIQNFFIIEIISEVSFIQFFSCKISKESIKGTSDLRFISYHG